MGPASGGDVEGAAGADQHSAHPLVHEVELDLFEGPFDQEGAEGVREGPQAGQGESGSGTDQELLADSDVDHPVRVRFGGVTEVLTGDLGVHQRRVGALVEQRDRGGGELLAGAHDLSSTRAMTAFGT